MDYLSILDNLETTPILQNNCACGGDMQLFGIEMQCTKCGFVRVGTDMETNATAAAPAFAAQDQMRTYGHVSNYPDARRKTSFADILAVYRANPQCDVPELVYLQTAQYYCRIQEHGYIRRNKVRRGIIAALFYRLCTAHLCTIKPAVVATMFGIVSHALSTGQKELDKLISNGHLVDPLPIDYRQCNAEAALIRIVNAVTAANTSTAAAAASPDAPTSDDPAAAFVQAITGPVPPPPTLENYIEFARKLIRFTNKYHIATSSVTTSKVAGALYIMYCNCEGFPITIVQIEAACSCVKTTAKRYADEIRKFLALTPDTGVNVDIAQARLRCLFATHGIPLNARSKKSAAKPGPRGKKPRTRNPPGVVYGY